jgi:hypothetical protein
MRKWLLAALLLSCTSGCTNFALERRTVNQAMSVTDLRYQEVLNNLAALSANPGTLPSFSLIGSGAVNVSDMAKLDSMTVWQGAIRGFTSEAGTLTASRSPDQSWTLDPVASQPQLEAMRCACLWVLCGPPEPASECMSLLGPPLRGETAGYHFDVADQLLRIPPEWLHTGGRADVPACACYVGHCGCHYVWVTPEGVSGLSEFTLVLLDIATVDPTSLQIPATLASVQTTLSSNLVVTDLMPAAQNQSGPQPGAITVLTPSFATIPNVSAGTVSPPVISPRPQIIMPRLLQQQSLINQRAAGAAAGIQP